jgi:hypothetical protein
MREQREKGDGKSTGRPGRPRAERAAPAQEAGVAKGGPLSPEAVLGLQRAVGNAVVSRMIDTDEVHEVLRSPGRKLEESLRSEMEARLGADFSDVRLHTGPAAERSATQIGARAYTSGSHVVLGGGGGDKHTLAHELAHVIQQRQGPVSGADNGAGLSISDPSDRFEREAEASAARAMSAPPAQDEVVQRSGAPGQQAQRVQRLVAYKSDDDTDPEGQQAFEDCVKGVDQAVQWAYDYVTSHPGLGALAQLDGHTKHWDEVWTAFLNHKRGALHKEFGYVVESLATYRMGTALTLPAGYTIGLQHIFGGTRPDVMLYGPRSAQVAALDITASGSTGHIWAKDGWLGRFRRIAEITYPSLIPTTVTMMMSRKDSAGPVSGTELANFQAQAAQRQLELERRCVEIRRDFMATVVPVFSEHSELFQLNNELARQVVLNWARSGRFDVQDAEGLDKTIAGVLAALNIDGRQYGFITGYTGSVARGQSFLLAADAPDSNAWGKAVPTPDLSEYEQPRQTRGDKRKRTGISSLFGKKPKTEDAV